MSMRFEFQTSPGCASLYVVSCHLGDELEDAQVEQACRAARERMALELEARGDRPSKGPVAFAWFVNKSWRLHVHVIGQPPASKE